MRKLLVETQLSLDAFAADTDGSTDWAVWNWEENWTWDEALRQHHTDLILSTDCILLSPKMTEGLVDYWADVAKIADDPRAVFARHIVDTPKVLFHKTYEPEDLSPNFKNTTIVKTTVEEEVPKLKNRSSGNIIAWGGADFISSLVAADLVDEYHLIVNPVVLGAGLPIFAKVKGRLDLKLDHATGYDCGVTLLKYTRK